MNVEPLTAEQITKLETLANTLHGEGAITAADLIRDMVKRYSPRVCRSTLTVEGVTLRCTMPIGHTMSHGVTLDAEPRARITWARAGR